MKRFFDLMVTLIMFPLVLLICFIVVVFIKIKLGSPVFFLQPRPGLNSKIFNMIKFRTMTDGRDFNGDFLPDSARLTKFGKFLRSTSLDELPELWNVLKGEMSLIGPRPLLIEYLPLYNRRQLRRHEVLPGITGWAQINGRNSISWEDKFSLDEWYVDNQSMWLDIKILFLTVKKITQRDGISQDGYDTTEYFKGSNSEKP